MAHDPPFKPDRTLFPFRSRWLESRAGGRVHYIDEGEGEPILFLHGNPTWSFLYRGIVIRLRKRFRCIALDYPGFGLSDHPDDYAYTPQEHADVVLELVRRLDLTNLTIMGQDWGGPIGIKTALDATERVRALVMGNTWYWPVEAVHMKGFAYVMSSEPAQWLIRERNLFVERMIPWGCKLDVAPEVLEHYRLPFPTAASREGIAVFPRQITGASFWLDEMAYAVPRVLRQVPLLLTWGIHDLAFPSRFMDRWREDFETVKVRRLDARHFIQEDRPAEISEAIEEFLLAEAAAPRIRRKSREDAERAARRREAETTEEAAGGQGENGDSGDGNRPARGGERVAAAGAGTAAAGDDAKDAAAADDEGAAGDDEANGAAAADDEGAAGDEDAKAAAADHEETDRDEPQGAEPGAGSRGTEAAAGGDGAVRGEAGTAAAGDDANAAAAANHEETDRDEPQGAEPGDARRAADREGTPGAPADRADSPDRPREKPAP